MAKGRIRLTDSQKRKKLNGLCITPYCTKRHAHYNNYCYSCIEEHKKAANPLYFTFYTWKKNSRRRKKINTVTFPEFKEFVGETDYMRKKGRGAKKFTIGRIRECKEGCPKEWCWEHGYHAWNIESVTLTENIYKHYNKKNYEDVPF